MIISRYSYFFKTSKNVYLAYSSKANSFMELSEDLFDILSKSAKSKSCIISANLPTDIMDILKHEGIICESADDDNDFVIKSQFVTQSVQHDRSKLNLVLVPTLDCNFNCPYCFEKGKRANTMNDEIINHLIDFIKGFESIHELNITWYGGEPLLAFPVIKGILERMDSELSVKITKHSMITNGYLINSKVIKLFQRFPLDSIQITLDGNRKRHDKLRALKTSNMPTYDHILNNIELVVNDLPNTEIHLRVNIDKNNVDDYYFIRDEIKSKYKSRNVIVYPGIIRLENEERTNIIEPAFGRWDTAYFLYNLYTQGLLEGNVYPTLRMAKTCCALCVNSYIIGPMGEIYKCWNDVSDASKVIGHIDNLEIENKSLYYRYHEGCAWYNDPICRDCFFMPICNGKCAWYNERNLYHGGSFNLCQCLQKAPGLLDKCLEYYYESVAPNK